MKKELFVKDIVEPCGLEVLCGADYLERPVRVSDINRPGLMLAGYLKYFEHQRIQVIGTAELTFLESLGETLAVECWKTLTGLEIPCVIITRGQSLPDEWLKMAEDAHLAVLRTSQPTTRFIGRLTDYLERCLAPSITIHGVLVDVHGIGTLITGDSGIGKSETALELIKRGHRLVADDAVIVTLVSEDTLLGRAPDMIRHLMEIRGLGILDIKTLFGIRAVRLFQEINQTIHLEEWQHGKYYDRLGIDDEKTEILGVSVPKTVIPVRPGRNLAGIVEVAAMNYRLKTLGFHTARDFVTRQTQLQEQEDVEDISDFRHGLW
ncbi:HPr kinase/phosphorylase [Propionispora sp. 2/2-37]|uniref:HPr(Ser) kinase/phosphatase n=1 Tax=Propionispora sp. 2/2-37 TaxID=1677858 RepID=UPI0006BB8D40|nr:HPr(Ser) kinase/phosphatase [Propionispora sp. 2/2-37]CUH95825.1 HPr kinase/phosphorylase [Propionispora sp. 2/2-37]